MSSTATRTCSWWGEDGTNKRSWRSRPTPVRAASAASTAMTSATAARIADPAVCLDVRGCESDMPWQDGPIVAQGELPKEFQEIGTVARSLSLDVGEAQRRLARVRRTYGKPSGLRNHTNPLTQVHVHEVDLLKVDGRTRLPDAPPELLAQLQALPLRTAPASSISRARTTRMCIQCSKSKDASRFPQDGFDVCESCVPAWKGDVDLEDRAYRGGSPGLGRKH